MKYLFLLVLFVVPTLARSQEAEPIDSQLKQQLDSILKEADMLYKYEKAAWVSTDMAFQESDIKDNIGEYLAYQDNNEVKAIFISRENDDCIAEYVFKDNFEKPANITTGERALTEREATLIAIRGKIIEQLSDPEYNIRVPSGYSVNLILIPKENKYSLYIITGTSLQNVIPFGNDYIFVADEEGKIESWKKFHSSLIDIKTVGPNGEKAIMPVHSHLRTTPLITATDICTFRLYGPLYEMDEFKVYSPALGRYMRYSISENTITLERKDRTK